MRKESTASFGVDSSWHHLVVAIDTSQSTASLRTRIYVDGTEITSFSTNIDYTLNANASINNNYSVTVIGRDESSGSFYDGLLDEFIFVDGQQLTPSDFATLSEPIEYTGTFGAKGFYLRFEDNSSVTTLGSDSSGNNINWTLVNMTVASSSTDFA